MNNLYDLAITALSTLGDKVPSYMHDPCFVSVMGSHAYGLATEESDYDLVVMSIPTRDEVYLSDYLHGFDDMPKVTHGFNRAAVLKNPEVDIQAQSLVRGMNLAKNGSPMIWEALLSPMQWVSSSVAPLVEHARQNVPLRLARGLHSMGKSQQTNAPHHSYRCFHQSVLVSKHGNLDVSDVGERYEEIKRNRHEDWSEVLMPMMDRSLEEINKSSVPEERGDYRSFLVELI